MFFHQFFFFLPCGTQDPGQGTKIYHDTTFSLFKGLMYGLLTLYLSFPEFYLNF